MKVDLESFCAEIVGAYDRKIAGLLLGCRRAGHLAVGADAAAEAMSKGAFLLVVACDAGSVVEKGFVAYAISESRAVAWKTKVELGTLFGREEISVVAVTNEAIAEQIQRARSRSEACRSREVR